MKPGDLVINEHDGGLWIIVKTHIRCIGTEIRMHEIFDGKDVKLCTGKVLKIVSEGTT
jgi:hypothetical protein